MATVDQPTSAPTNKLSTATLGTAIAAAAYAIVAQKWPVLKDPVIWVPVAPALSGFFALIPGYFKRESDAATKATRGFGWWPLIIGGVVVAALVAGAAVLVL